MMKMAKRSSRAPALGFGGLGQLRLVPKRGSEPESDHLGVNELIRDAARGGHGGYGHGALGFKVL